MEREEMRVMAAGHFAQTNRSNGIEVEKMDKFVEGAVFAFDKIQAKKVKTWERTDQPDGKWSNGTEVRPV